MNTYLYIQCLAQEEEENMIESIDRLKILFHNLVIYSPFNGYFILTVILQQTLLSLYCDFSICRELRVGCSVSQ